MKATMKLIGKRIRVARIERDMKQDDLADEMHVSQNTVSSWESGRTALSSVQLPILARILQKPVAYFYESFDATDNRKKRAA